MVIFTENSSPLKVLNKPKKLVYFHNIKVSLEHLIALIIYLVKATILSETYTHLCNQSLNFLHKAEVNLIDIYHTVSIPQLASKVLNLLLLDLGIVIHLVWEDGEITLDKVKSLNSFELEQKVPKVVHKYLRK